MEHITNVLVYSNRCEVLDSHIFTVGDRGFPHIKLKFIYMFGAETLQGKRLELKYILPDKSYHLENAIISSKDEVIFPIHYSVFVNGGWTTLKVAIIDGQNKITLDDIIIKTKKLSVGEKFKSQKIEELIQAEVIARTKEVKAEGEKQKKIIQDFKSIVLDEIEKKKNTLKGDRGPGITTITNIGDKVNINYDDGKLVTFTVPTIQGIKGDKGDIGPQGIKGETGATGREIQDLSYINNKLKIVMNDGSSKEVEINSRQGAGIKIRRVFEGELTPYNTSRIKLNIGNKWRICICEFKTNDRDFSTFNSEVEKKITGIFFKNANEISQRIGNSRNDTFVDVSIKDNILKYNSYVAKLKTVYVIEDLEIDENNPGEISSETNFNM